VQLALDKQQADVGLYVSARNRPFWYNGLVLLEPGGEGLARQFLAPDNDPARDAAARDAFATQPFPITSEVNPAGSMFIADSTIDTRKPYLDMLVHLVDVNLIRRATLTIFVDPMHGTTAGLLPGVIGEGSQTKAIEINRETDPLFGRGTPLPSETGLARLRKLVRESDSHLGLAFSADGTSLGVVDKNGNQLGQLEVVLLLASYLMHQHRQSGVVVAPPPGPNSPLAGAVARLGTWENVLGFRVELIQESTQRINEILSQEQPNLLLGCTLQGELIVGSYHPYPDALIAGLFITELVARNGGSLRASLDKLLADLGA
jgi:phosphomannomutase